MLGTINSVVITLVILYSPKVVTYPDELIITDYYLSVTDYYLSGKTQLDIRHGILRTSVFIHSNPRNYFKKIIVLENTTFFLLYLLNKCILFGQSPRNINFCLNIH